MSVCILQRANHPDKILIENAQEITQIVYTDIYIYIIIIIFFQTGLFVLNFLCLCSLIEV